MKRLFITAIGLVLFYSCEPESVETFDLEQVRMNVDLQETQSKQNDTLHQTQQTEEEQTTEEIDKDKIKPGDI